MLGVGLSSVAAAPLTERKHPDDDFEGTPVWVLYVASMALVLLGGAFAGLTIAYVNIRPCSKMEFDEYPEFGVVCFLC